VDRDQDNHVLDHPHVFLDEIMRQAKDSEIIRLSMWVREGKPLATFPQVREQVQIFNKNEVSMGMYEWADQIICATNRNRNQINNLMRQARGFGPEPTSGDRVISLRNHWNDFSNSGTWALTNGAIGTIEDFEKIDVRLPKPIAENPVTYLYANILLEDGDSFTRVPIDYKSIVDGTPALDGKQIYRLRQWKKAPRPPYEFAYAYAITCHKSQGSQWDKVLAFEETFPFEDTEHARWVYTAVTRAAQKLVVIKR
jgi:exodeoxyribonuclease-5